MSVTEGAMSGAFTLLLLYFLAKTVPRDFRRWRARRRKAKA